MDRSTYLSQGLIHGVQCRPFQGAEKVDEHDNVEQRSDSLIEGKLLKHIGGR